ncbi:hypothetical protein PGN35_028070 [Nodosilinea sp. PGN35]|uniref:hypothetical protein n=1 Tax=Nodosilinea sp. PGN35 TaxID=3020489 RepID=UPI0023B24813|nr:hypothetical protein [Nodosilinea sp. TSF1-S3]MDF0365295.1 hypothetical protein [Nodosilinea sp. TSF1-S3]
MDEQRRSITIPSLNLAEKMQPVRLKIKKLLENVSEVSFLNPFSIFQLNSLSVARKELEAEFSEAMEYCWHCTRSPIQGAYPASGGMLAVWHLSMGMTTMQDLNNSWNSLDSAIDRKYTYIIACVSLYLAIFSLILPLASPVLSLTSKSFSSQVIQTKNIQPVINKEFFKNHFQVDFKKDV